jgi:glutamate/tyrosine decarboxylase-like PLP-dependent enzyme
MEPPAPVRDLDWSADRAEELGAGVLELWSEWLGRLRELPVAQRETAAEVAAAVAVPVPEEPTPTPELLAYLRELVFEHSVQMGHPTFMAYISGAGTVPGAPADLLAAAINQNVGGFLLSPGATEIELALTRWLAGRFGLPSTAAGLLVTGGGIANFVALKTARDAAFDWRTRQQGVRGLPPMAIYCSDEAHVTIDRAADMLGLGTDAVRRIPADADFRLRVDELRAALAADREAGIVPVAIVGTAGTTATGAIDPLEEIAELCADEGVWFHVDAAYGGPIALSDTLRPRLNGIERADSVTVDPHKWLYTPQSGGCVIVRDLDLLERSFLAHASYVRQDKELTGRDLDLGELGPAFSRSFWALKVWVSLLAHGRRAYARRIEHDIQLARYLYERADEHPELEAMANGLSIACFRYVPRDLPDGPDRDGYLDRLNERLMHELQLGGLVFPSNAVLPGGYAIRACIVNFRTEAPDCDALLAAAVENGARVDAELRVATV